MPAKILLADDDNVLTDMLARYLSAEGYIISTAGNGQQVLDQLVIQPYSLIVMDIMMPLLGGIEALQRLRKNHSTPVIMLTARGDDLDRILGLELGADDYLAKPCNPRELLARIRAILRRSQPTTITPTAKLAVGDLSLDPNYRIALVAPNSKIKLTQTEFDILYLLISQTERYVTRNELSLQVLDKPLSQWDRSIDVHISNLRKKLGLHKDGGDRIMTLRGSGYRYVTAQQSPR